MRQGRVVQISGAHRRELHLYPKIIQSSYDNLRAITLAESTDWKGGGIVRLDFP